MVYVRIYRGFADSRFVLGNFYMELRMSGVETAVDTKGSMKMMSIANYI
jgi:hypothetical protein